MQKWITNPIFDRKMRSKQERVSRMFDLRPLRNMLSGDLERSGRGYAQILWAMPADLVPMMLFDTDGIEAMNEKFDGKVVTLVSAKCSAEWARRRNYLSPCPTTKCEDYILSDYDLAEHNLHNRTADTGAEDGRHRFLWSRR